MATGPQDLVVSTWHVHNSINLALIAAVPDDGFKAVPLKSRGRSVAGQLIHMHEVRLGWLHFHTTGQRPTRAELPPRPEPLREPIEAAFVESGTAVAELLHELLANGTKLKMFGGNPVRWMGYLISHESHHRGQIALALKQNGMRLPEKVSLNQLWGKWFFGR